MNTKDQVSAKECENCQSKNNPRFAHCWKCGYKMNVAVIADDIVKAQDSKKCPHCAELVKKEAQVCRFCGNKFGLDGFADDLGKLSDAFLGMGSSLIWLVILIVSAPLLFNLLNLLIALGKS